MENAKDDAVETKQFTKPKMLDHSTTMFFEQRKSALPSYANQCTFEFHNLNVFVGEHKQILFNCCGTVRSGEFLALMGGSGAGKSTLLNALSGRTNLNQKRIEGYIAINGKKFDVNQQKIVKSMCTYVPQSDVLCATQTVEEALLFYAELKLSRLTKAMQKKRISYLINVLRLDKCKNNYIGDEKRKGISGGEKRRTSIASEIMNNVDIIFLDEPTSGLDAYTAARTIKTLKQFCSVSNKIVIAAIHQPSIEVFYSFDQLMLLGDGRCCFNGSTNDLEIYFKEQLKPRTNPADVILFELQRHPEEYAIQWKRDVLSDEWIDNNSTEWQTYELVVSTSQPREIFKVNVNTKKAPLLIQYKLLLKREFQSLYRDMRVTVIRLLQVIFLALLCGGIFFEMEDAFSKKTHAFFLLTLIALLFGIVSMLIVFPKQKLLFIREHNSGAYSTLSWSLSFIIIEVPREAAEVLIFTTIIYYMIGLDGSFVEYWFTLFLTSFAGGSYGMLFGTICKTSVEATQMTPVALLPLIMFSDIITSISDFPMWLQWVAKINPLYYLMRCCYIIEFRGMTYWHYDQCCMRYSYKSDCSTPVSGETFLNTKNLDGSELTKYWIYVIIICFCLRIISIALLKIINNHLFAWIGNKIKYKLWCCFFKVDVVKPKNISTYNLYESVPVDITDNDL